MKSELLESENGKKIVNLSFFKSVKILTDNICKGHYVVFGEGQSFNFGQLS